MYQRQKSIHSMIQTLTHENALLKNRNKLLSQENTRLLQQIQYQKQVASSTCNIEGQCAVRQRERICQFISSKFANISEQLEKLQYDDQEIAINCQLMKQIDPNKKLLASISLGFEMLQKLLSNLDHLKLRGKSQKLQSIENKLRNRIQQRKKLKRNESIVGVHFIKDSTDIVNHLASSSRLQNEDFSYLKKFYESLIFDLVYHLTNKGKVNHRKLEAYLGSFSDSVQLRIEVKKCEGNMSLVEREYEMGNIGECVIKQAIDNHTKASQQLKKKRLQISQLYSQVLI